MNAPRPVQRFQSTALTMEERLDLKMNDEDNAARILSAYGDDIVFVSGKGWAVWDGTRYSFRSGNLAAREIGHRLRALVNEEAEWLEENYHAEPEDVDAFMEACLNKRPPILLRTHEDALRAMGRTAAVEIRKHAIKCGNIAKVKSALEACEYQRRAEIEEMDSDPWSLVLPNGQLDLRKVRDWERPIDAEPAEVRASKMAWLGPTDRASLPTKCTGVPFDPDATCPGWEAFIALVVPDAQVRACVQRCLGATLFGENRAQVCMIFRGPGGNGKSTLLNGLSHVMGTRDGYAAPCKIEMFLETGNAQASAATPEEADLPGARLYIATEPGARDVLSAKKIKGLTGGDRRMSRGLFSDPFFWTPRGVPLLSCNRTPKIKDEDEGTRRRLVFIPLNVKLQELPADQRRSQGEVEAEHRAEGSGILNWLLDGFRDFMDRGIDMPEEMSDLKRQLMEAADPVGVFLAEMTIGGPLSSTRINVTDFYKVYEAWCEQEGRTLYQNKTVRDIMVEKGVESGKVRGYSHWKGITWNAESADIVERVTGSRPNAPQGPDLPEDVPF
ncbi:MAG: phage/plasmid primase, P4 family [Pseudomonadota bacterium]